MKKNNIDFMVKDSRLFGWEIKSYRFILLLYCLKDIWILKEFSLFVCEINYLIYM